MLLPRCSCMPLRANSSYSVANPALRQTRCHVTQCDRLGAATPSSIRSASPSATGFKLPASYRLGLCSAVSFGHRPRRCRVPRASNAPDAVPKGKKPKFDLALAVALAGTAFEAYLEPTGAEGFQQITFNDTKITYADRTFVADNFQGLLEVNVLRASGLPAADFTGKSDPYVVLSLADSTARTNFKFQTLEPEWNETCFLYIRNIEEDVLKVRVFDKDFLDSDDDLGVVMQGLRDLQPNQPMEVELKLQGNGGGGTVYLQLTLMPFTGYDSAVVEMLTADDVKLEGMGLSSTSDMPDLMSDMRERMNIGEAASEPSSSNGDSQDAAKVGPSTEDWTSAISWEQLKGILQNISTLRESLPLGSSLASVDQASSTGTSLASSSSASPPGTEGACSSGAAAEGEGGGTQPAPLDPALMPKAWKVLANVAGKQIEDHFIPVAFVENDETDTQVWVYQNRQACEVVVSFRGTEQVKWKDFVTDLNLTPCSLNPERIDSNAGLPFSLRLLTTRKQEEMVHSGFLSAYDSVRGQVLKLVDQMIGGSQRPWRVYVTGHSLGGALATLCSYELAIKLARTGQDHSVCMYTFGAPRVGNAQFAANFRSYVPDSWRITNAADIIPTVPRLMGYSHVKRGVKLSKDGELIFEDGSADVFGEGRHTREVVEEILSKVQEEKWDEVYEAIQSAEMELLNTLVSGEALEQHMETFYLRTLRQCVIVYNPTVAKEIQELEKTVKGG